MSDTINIGGITVSKFYLGGSSDVKIYLGTTKLYPHLQEPCFAVVDNISTYTARTYVDVYETLSDKWYKLNNLSAYEEYGIYGSGRTITYYEGKLTIDGDYEYQYSGSSWVNVGEVSGSTYLEYLERTSTYNGYMPLGEYFTENTVIQMDFQMTQAKGNAIIGDYGSNDNDDWRIFLNYDTQVNNFLIYDFINSRNYYNTGNWSKRFHLEIGNYYIKDLNTSTYLVNATRKTSFTRPNQMYLFHMEGSQVTNNIDYGKIYSVKIYQNGTLVKDFVPWTDGNGNYGLYDNVSSSVTQSIGSMTGSTGVTIEYPIYYDEIQDPPDNLVFSSMTEAEEYECPYVGMKATINGDRYIFSGDSQSGYEWVYNPSRLPDGYTEVEYVENTSTAYINLGVNPYSANGNSFIVESTFSSFTQSSFAYLISTEYTTSPYYGFILRWDNNNLQLGGGSIGIDTTATNIPNGDGTSAITFYSDSTTTNNGNTPITLFCGLNRNSPWRNGKGKCYSFKLTINSNIVRDLVPCKRDSDDKYGMYDIVNDVFYVSPNNVNFIGGNPV